MAKYFTQEEIEKLRNHPYVTYVDEQFLHLTAECKRLFFQRYTIEKKPQKILRELGLDPKLLGATRVHSITMHIVKEFDKKGFFSDILLTAKENHSEMAKDYKIKYLEDELERTRQENIYLKKISFLHKKEKRK